MGFTNRLVNPCHFLSPLAQQTLLPADQAASENQGILWHFHEGGAYPNLGRLDGLPVVNHVETPHFVLYAGRKTSYKLIVLRKILLALNQPR